MEDLKRSLSAGTNSSTVLQSAGKLLSSVVSSNGETEEDLQLVWVMLGSSSVLTGQACSDIITSLVVAGKLEVGATIVQLLASLSHGMEFTGIIPALGNILCHQVEVIVAKTGEYKNPYAISSSQHPFISVLRSTPTTWSLVMDQCLHILSHPKEVVSLNALIILRPVLFYLFSDPNHHSHFGAMRAGLLDVLLEMAREDDSVLTFLVEMMNWFQMDNKASLPETAQYVYKVFSLSLELGQAKLITPKVYLLASIALYQVKFGLSPTRSINWLSRIFDSNSMHPVNWDVVLVVLEQVLTTSSHIHHDNIMSLILALVSSRKTTQLPTGLVVSTALQSLSFPTVLGVGGTAKKAELVRLFYKLDWSGTKNMQEVEVTFDSHVSSAVEVVKISSLISCSPPLALHWLKSMSSLSHTQLSRALPLLSALFLCSTSPTVAQQSLDLMLRCVVEQASHSSMVLTLLLHKLASKSSTSDSEVKLALLHALPSMAGDKGCISLIMKLVTSLASKPSMAPLRLTLLSKLWRVESRCYPFLQKALLEPVPITAALEYQITQAAVIRDIVSTHATQYGSDLLPSLSNLLNQCSGPEGTTAARIALEGIYTLCKESVIDMRTTVKVLAPKCGKDRRPMVIVQYIKLLGLAPTFRLSGPEYINFLSDTINWLWKTATTVEDKTVVQAAYQAIAKFPLEATKLRMLPCVAREGLKLPAKYCATPSDAARKPEDVLSYVPSECWVKLLVNTEDITELTGVEGLLCSLTREEVTNLPRAVYNLSQAMQNSGTEPVNYNHLPEHSVARGLVGAIITAATSRRELPKHPAQQQQENTSLAAWLRILAQDHGRPLPPLDWAVLEPFFPDAALRGGVTAVLARQTASSRSARIVVERQLAVEQGKDTTMHYMSSLSLLAVSIPPQILTTWLNKSLQSGLQSAIHSDNTTDLAVMFNKMKEALEEQAVPDANQLVLSQALESLHDMIPADQEHLYDKYLDAATRLPLKNIERMSSPTVWWEVTPAKLYRAASLRTALATSDNTDTPLAWLNEILEVASKQAGDYTFIFRNILTVMTKCRATSKQLNTSWLLELMGQISALLRKAGPLQSIGSAIPFLLDVFNLAIIVLTETDSLVVPRDQICVSRASRLSLLSLSTCRLATMHPGMAGQVAEWCLQLSRHKEVASPHKESLLAVLKVFKYSTTWQEASMWGRLVVA
eukprot:GFUD01039886.1.p1 GENE.GFUD01039886.1~~GFUD01039886.1.p1  ORF type:complete len:1196 (+),score=396.15 GFUD01039886.1:57-3644(+)